MHRARRFEWRNWEQQLLASGPAACCAPPHRVSNSMLFLNTKLSCCKSTDIINMQTRLALEEGHREKEREGEREKEIVVLNAPIPIRPHPTI